MQGENGDENLVPNRVGDESLVPSERGNEKLVPTTCVQQGCEANNLPPQSDAAGARGQPRHTCLRTRQRS